VGSRGVFLFIPLMFPAFIFSGLVSNLLLSKIPNILRGLDREAETQGNPKYEKSQKLVLKLLPWVAIPTFTISIIAAAY
jgi:hypothetical protein